MCALPARYSCSVTGAIGNCIKNHSHIRIFERNNQESFTSFLLTLKKNLKNIYSQSKPYIVLDNFSGHKTNKSLRVLENTFNHFGCLHILVNSTVLKDFGPYLRVTSEYIKLKIIPIYRPRVISSLQFNWVPNCPLIQLETFTAATGAIWNDTWPSETQWDEKSSQQELPKLLSFSGTVLAKTAKTTLFSGTVLVKTAKTALFSGTVLADLPKLY